MRKPTFCICENKDADQRTDQRHCFRNIDSTIPLLSKSEISSLQPSFVAWFVFDLVGNQNVGFLMTWLNYGRLRYSPISLTLPVDLT